MKYALTGKLIFLALFPYLLLGQTDFDSVEPQSPPAYIGFDILNGSAIPFFFPGSMKVGISAGLPMNTKAKTGLNISAGYARLRRDTIFVNLLDYKSEGWYVKIGFENYTSDFFSWGIRGGYTQLSETGQFVLEGPFFGDKIVEHEGLLKQALMVEPYFNLWLRKWRNFSANMSLSIPFLLVESLNREVPVHYVPGFGFSVQNDEFFLPVSAIFEINLLFNPGR